MRKRSASSVGSQHSQERNDTKHPNKMITFDYQQLDCFLHTPYPKKLQTTHITPSHRNKQIKPQKGKQILQSKPTQCPLSRLYITRRNKGKIISNTNGTFNYLLLLLEYQNQDDSGKSKDRKDESEEDNEDVRAVVKSCLRVITEDTENSSNPASTPYTHRSHTQVSAQTPSYPTATVSNLYYYSKRNQRNRRAISWEESIAFVIHPNRIEADGRTTIMVRNIPNKYTQEMLIRLFERGYRRKFDFFYMPIDYNNNCNVGYAFINFLSSKFISQFYLQFHNNRWDKFNSYKVCHLCYARIQGTAQLAKHFENSSVLQQRDRRCRPLIGIKSLPSSINSLVNKQKQAKQQQPYYQQYN